MPLPERLAAEYFAARDRQQQETFRNQGLGQHHRLGPESLLIRAGATRAPRALILDELSARQAISSKEVRITGTRDERESP